MADLQAEAEFVGGPVDGEVVVMRRHSDGRLPDPFAVVTLAGSPADLDPDSCEPLPTLTYVYRLRADVGPLAVYDFKEVHENSKMK